MPIVNIALLEGKSREHIRAIADGVHRALVETYNVPPDDHFQLINQYKPDDFIYDETYLGIRRSPDVVFIQITAGNWRDTATKKAFYERAADLLAEAPGLRREDVQIILSPTERDDWSFGNGEASYVKNAA